MNHITNYLASSENTNDIFTENHLALVNRCLIVSVVFPCKCLKWVCRHNRLIHARYHNMVVNELVFSIHELPIICQDSLDWILLEIGQNDSSLKWLVFSCHNTVTSFTHIRCIVQNTNLNNNCPYFWHQYPQKAYITSNPNQVCAEFLIL